MRSDLIKEIDNKMKELKIEKGAEFTAYHKLSGKIKYRYEGYGDINNSCFSIHLRNLDRDDDTFVEPLWFDQRKIELI